MFEINGKYSTAKVFATTIDNDAISQLIQLCSQEFTKGAKIRIMPDVHAGTGCTIGFTANLGDMVIPNIVGVDIGCGMLCVKLGKVDIDFNKFDNIIRKYVPSGFEVHKERKSAFTKLENMNCYAFLEDTARIECSMGTLGGGNHFIELDKDDEGTVYLVIHTGSRSLGRQVAKHYQKLAEKTVNNVSEQFAAAQNKLIEEYKAQGKTKELQSAINILKAEFKPKTSDVPKDLCYLTGENRELYLADMAICQEFATQNRKAIANAVLSHYFGKSLSDFESFETIHNYIDLKNGIVRKGAISAQKNEMMLIPINMRDGALICTGKGNEDWNCSAPHGAGRILSRGEAKETLSIDEYKREMDGVFSTCVSQATLDESPMAYKNIDEIVEGIEPTAEIIKQIKPIYNFKAS